MKGRVFLGMSGGVDSAVAGAILLQQGYEVHGVFIKAWEEAVSTQAACPWEEDQREVERVCRHLGIPWETWNLTREYSTRVFDYMIREFQSGRTPNPDIMCNREIKFNEFLKRAMAAGADFIATGHYVRCVIEDHEYTLCKGVDMNKDQSYFLYTLSQEQLAKTLFPIGEMKKNAVRLLARKLKLPNADRKDSQGICFIGNVKMKDFLQPYLNQRAGRVLDNHGRNVGTHQGQAFYTIGQRRGIGVGGGAPYYVVAKNSKTNTITVARENHDTLLLSSFLTAQEPSWVGKTTTFPLTCTAKIRYRQPDQDCFVTEAERNLNVSFSKPQRAVTPGQSIVFYQQGRVLGGAIINDTHDNK
ncbi:MAG: tRNA 2-thiouridine(34) synthase MnmA [Parcubacteria group bacterium]